MGWRVILAMLCVLDASSGAPVQVAPAARSSSAAPRPPVTPAEATAPNKEDFLGWAKGLARAKKLSVCRAGQLRYAGEAAGYFAMLGKAEPHDQADAVWVFGQGQAHWSHGASGSAFIVEGCPADPPWEQAESVTVASVGIGAHYIWDNYDVTFVEGEPVILDEEHHDADGGTHRNWLRATERTFENDQAEQDSKGVTDLGLLVAMPPASRWLKTWKTPTFVPFGAKNRQNAADADLAAYAVDRGNAGIQLVVDVSDDVVVPTAAGARARAFIRGDHLEIWWRPDDASVNKQLGIGLPSDGTADVRWLLPSKTPEATPPVRRTRTHFEIDLSLATLGLEGSAPPPDGVRTLPLAVAFSDADDPAAGQQTVVATGPIRWNRQDTFSQLAWLSSKSRRFPSFGTPVAP
jgi:hypothetical protein